MMNPDIVELDPAEAYTLWARNYPAYAHNPLMLAEERAMLADLPQDLRGKRVLDAGCGSGRYLQIAARRCASAIVGIDLSREMLLRDGSRDQFEWQLAQASLDAIPLPSGWADVTLCGLVLGHVPDLCAALRELRRVTRIGGAVVCSDFHPIGKTLGWKREFKSDGRKFAVRHWTHSVDDWRRACAAVGLRIHHMSEPHLNSADVPAQASFDPAALHVPVAIVFALESM